MARYTTDEVMAMMQSPQPEVEMLERPASPFLDPAQINAAERELSQPAPEVPRPDSINAPGANLLLQNYTAEEAFPIDQTPAPQRPADGNATLYPSRAETSPNLPKPRYTTDEVISLYANESKPRLSTKQVMVEMIKPLYDPTLPRPSKEEFFKLREVEKQLRESGDIPSNFEETTRAVGGFFLTAADALNTALWKVDREQGLFEFGGMGVNPALAVSETWRRSPGTLAYGAEMTKQGYAAMDAGLRAMGGPRYRVKETGEFVMTGDMDSSLEARRGVSGGDIVKEYAARGLTLTPVNDEDKRDFEYLQWNQGMDRAMEVEKARTADYPEETVYKILSNAPAGFSDTAFGTDYLRALENRPAPPMESQAVGASILADPATYLSLGAGAAKIGLSAAMKGATARSLDVIGKATQRFVGPAEMPVRAIDRFRKVVVSPAKVAGAYGAASGVAWAADQFNLPNELKTAAFTAASLYTAYKGGLGVLRFAGKNLPEAAVILRESADATSGLDRAARQAVATNPNVPANIRDRLLRPSQFVAMESTPARLAQNQQLSPGTRKLMDKLSNFYVVQGVRGASAVATGAVKGGATMVPFAEAMRLSGDERSADTMYGMGIALGALGGAGERVLGARGRRMAQAESDIGRMLTDIQAGNVQPGVKRYQWIDREVGRLLTDVELAAGDVTALLQNRSFDELARTAAMQGFFRNVDYIPLNAADFELNAKEHGGSGAAGYFIKAPVGERPQIFVNVEARRADVEPHEYFEAFFSSDAFSPEQRAAMRAQVDQRYGAEGLMARGREYAEALIKADNAKNFPNENLVVSDEQIRVKMDELAQDELTRGGQDPLDWVRREVMVEEARMAGVDFAAIRRNVPAGANPITFMENVLGASARALGLSGVRIDPETGMAITPEQLFRENPVAANDPKLVKHLNDYIKAYRQWMNDPTHEVPQGVRIARDGRIESLADNPNVSFYSPKPEDPTVARENALAIMGPDGRVIEKSPKQRRTERKARNTQVKNLAGRNLLAPGDPTFGLKRWADGRIRAGGRRLPQSMALQVHWKPWLPIINAIEGLADANESMQVRYFAKGNSADKVKTSRFSDVDAINREVVFDQWTTNAAGDLLAQLLDMTTLRNRAMRAISERHPALDPANGGPGYSLQAIMDDVNQWMADKRAGKDGAATIGNDRKNVVNALINPGTAVNRGKNPLAGTFGKGSAIKTLLLENINAVSGTGRKGAAMDYNWANGNFMPDKPAPRPDMDSDVPAPRGLVNNRMPQQIPREAQGMPDAPASGRSDGMPDRKSLQQRAKDLGLPATGTTKEIARMVSIGEKSPYEWTREEFNEIAPHLSIHQDMRPGSDSRVQQIMERGLQSGMVDSVGAWGRRHTWAGGKMTGDNAYLFISNKLKYRQGNLNPWLDEGNKPIAHIKTKPGQTDIYEALVASRPQALPAAARRGQAMPDAVHGDNTPLPPQVPDRGFYIIGTKPTADGRVLEYHLDPATTIQPRVADIESIRGEQVAMLEADRHNTRGDNMGGPLHPFLISNQTIARLPDGRGFKAVWANMNSAFVTRAKNIVKNTTAGHALIQIMKENAHRSNRKFVMDVTSEIDARRANMTSEQADFLHVLLELGAINPQGRINQAYSRIKRASDAALEGEATMAEVEEAQRDYDQTFDKYQPMVEFLNRLSPLKSHATQGRSKEFAGEFASVISKHGSSPWYSSMASKYRNTKFVDEAARFSFKQRGAAMDRITGIPFAPDVKAMLKNSMDFVNGQNLDVVGVVQLSKDMDAFAVYFGKNPKEEAKMSANERMLRDQFLASGTFKAHPSYDWVMLGPENADSFILDAPADPLRLFPDYAKNHPNPKVKKGSKETVVGTMKKSKIPLVLK